MQTRIIVFGEASQGDLHLPTRPKDLCDLRAQFGDPPEGSLGIFFAVQTLLFERELFFIRVLEEGFSLQSYYSGLRELLKLEVFRKDPVIIGAPGCGDEQILEAFHPLSERAGSMLLLSERDLYDYLTYSFPTDRSV